MRRIAPLLELTLCIALAAAGCRPSSPSDGEEGSTTANSAEGKPEGPSPEERIQALNANFEEIRGRLVRSQDTPAQKMATLRLFIQNAKLNETTLRRKLPVVARAEAEMEKLRLDQEKEEAEVYRKLEEQVMALLDGAPPDVEKASRIADEFPVDRYKRSPILPRVDELKARILLYGNAEREAAHRKERVKLIEDPKLRIAILEGFDPEFDRTPFAEDVRKLIKESYGQYAESLKARKAVQDTVKWDQVPLDSYQKIWPEEHDCTRLEEGVLTIGPNTAEAIKDDPPELARAAGTCVRLGNDDWIDVELQFEAQVTAGEGIFFGARGHDGAQGYNFHWKGLEDLAIADQDWHNFLVRIEGTSMVITDATGKQLTRNDRLREIPGPFGVRLTGDRAVLKIRNLQVRVLRKDASADSAPEAEEPSKEAPKKKKKKKKAE